MRKPVLFALALIVAAAMPVSAQDRATTVLVMDVRRIIDESAEGRQFVIKLRQQIAEKKKDVTQRAQKLQEEVKGLMEAKLHDRNEEWYKDFRAAAAREVALKAEQVTFERELGDELGRAITQIVRGSQQEARLIMKERGADVVIASKMGPISVESDQELQREIISRRVVCSRKDVDITDEVIKRMNKWWQANKSKKGAPPKRGKIAPAKKNGKPAGPNGK